MNSIQNPSVPYRAVGYRRVSMPDQVNGFSLDAQETNITKYIETRNWQLINIYVDAGISAKKGSKRPALEKLLLDAKAGKFDVVVVDKIDRFYRHLGGLLATLDDLNSHGVAFASVQEQLDFTTPWGKLMLTVLGTLAEIYLDNLRQETRKGKLQRARQGLWVGELPFGYCKGLCSRCTNPNGKDYCPEYGKPDKTDGKIIMPHPVESLVVKKVFDWYCHGDTSHRSIADELNKTILTLPDGSTVPARQRGKPGKTDPRPFTRDIIRDMVLRETYAGRLAFFGNDEVGKHRKRKKPLEIVQAKHQAIIDEETFSRAQEMRILKGSNCIKKHDRPVRIYPFTGILRCGYCGGSMRGTSSSRRYYKDGNKLDHLCVCPQPVVVADKVENQMVQWLLNVINQSDPDNNEKEAYALFDEQEKRFDRAKELYLLGEVDRSVYEFEKERFEIERNNLQSENYHARMTFVSLIHWQEISNLERKRLLRLTIEVAYVRGNALAAIQPSSAFLPITALAITGFHPFSGCNSGEGGIRTRDRF